MVGRRGGTLWSTLTSLGSLGDGADQLCHVWSPLLCVVAALLLLAKTQFGQPIQCWPPPEMNQTQIKYAETVCMTSKHYQPLDTLFLLNFEQARQLQVPAHNWVVAVLLLQAFLFYLPAMLWKYTCNLTGTNTVAVLQVAQRMADDQPVSGSADSNALRILSGHVKGQCGTRGRVAVLLYLLKKVAMVLIVDLQLSLINPLLSSGFVVYVPALVIQYLTEPTHDLTLPEIVMCDFKAKALGSYHEHALQCVLSINTLIQKMCVLVWCMLLAVLLATVVSMLRWAVLLLLPAARTAHINRHLQASGATQSNEDGVAARRFVVQNLGVGGFLQLCLMSHSTDDLLVTQVVEALWSSSR